MITKITDDRLKAIIESTPEYETYLLDALNELVSLRSQVKALVEDGERIYAQLEPDLRTNATKRRYQEICEQHTALLKELEK